jgi:hypothetical protein
MKTTLIILISSFITYFAWGVTCNGLGCNVVDSGHGCSLGPDLCRITADGVCYIIINSTGNVVFIPTEAGTGNWATFYNDLPAGMVKSTDATCTGP